MSKTENAESLSGCDLRVATKEDQKWVGKIFDLNRHVLGNVSGGTVFWRWTQANQKTQKWIVIPGKAFCHYGIRKDGTKYIYEIAVHPDCKRMGLARELLNFVGRPVELKTDATHTESNLFYLKIGLTCVGTTTARSGKILNVYQGW